MFGPDLLAEEIERRLDASDPAEPVHTAAWRVLAEAGTILLTDPDAQWRRRTVIDSSPELQERDRTKTAQTAAALARSLTRRGASTANATLVGAVLAEIFRSAYESAFSDGRSADFAKHLARAGRTVEAFLTSDVRQ